MPKNYELDQLKSAEQALFQQKQGAFQRYAHLREQARLAHDEMQDAWEERTRARERMNREFETRQNAFEHRDSIWEEYQRIRDDNNRQIEYLRSEADYEHQAMKDCFERASNAYECGDKSEAPIYAEEGRDHKERRNELNDEVGRLIQEIKDAKSYAEMHAPRVDSSAFNSAKDAFEQAKQCHESAQGRFKQLKSSRDETKAEFDHLQEEFLRAKEAFQTKLNEVRAIKEARVRKVESALMPATGFFDGKAAKIKERNDGSGKTDVYFGGMNLEGDGLGHGHAVIEASGQVTYLRGQFQDHDDWQINDAAGTPNKHGKVRFPGEHTKI